MSTYTSRNTTGQSANNTSNDTSYGITNTWSYCTKCCTTGRTTTCAS
jgi:hypothetical protein